MRKLLSVLAATVLAASFALPLNAAPIFVPKTELARADAVEQVHYRRYHKRHKHYSHRRAHRHLRRHAVRHCGYYGDCYPRYSGYRRHYGYHHYPRYHRRSGVTIYFQF